MKQILIFALVLFGMLDIGLVQASDSHGISTSEWNERGGDHGRHRPRPYPQPYPQPYPRPYPVPTTRVITVVGRDSGGTSHGDRNAACNRAYSRAEYDAANSCASYRGYLISTRAAGCDCRRKPGSRDDYNCTATVYGDCEIRERIYR